MTKHARDQELIVLQVGHGRAWVEPSRLPHQTQFGGNGKKLLGLKSPSNQSGRSPLLAPILG